jgi:hypothetical protein
VGDEIFIENSAFLTISYSDVEGGEDSVVTRTDGDYDWGDGMIDTDPVYRAPDYDDYRLHCDSPCIDAGDSTISDACLPPGQGGDRSDMGAYGGEGNCGWLEDPGVHVWITPYCPLAVYGGDRIEFDALIYNNDDKNVAGDYWRVVRLPNSSEILIPSGLLDWENPLSGSVQGNNEKFLEDGLGIPTAAGTGTYRIIVRIGRYPDRIMDEDWFEFEVIE